ncbi:MAG TPA: M1 family metallopeptidase [Solirubrobacterales bacterium]|nr:M1 family metallopeptidase [Solirubrobacterales bacterium]
MISGAPRRWRLGVVAGLIAAATLIFGLAAAPAEAKKRGCSPGEPRGAAGVGDEYYPNYGNGGYDVGKYALDITYKPSTARITRGKATISARATQSVCRFNLDFVRLKVRKIKVDGDKAKWRRTEHELKVTPKDSLERGRRFETVVRYRGEPTEFVIPGLDLRTGFMDTSDGATVAGQPEVAAGWFPVNDHPRDKARYEFDVTVPKAYEVVTNGFLRDVDTHKKRKTWEWNAREPMASYLATIDIGFWDVHRWRTGDDLPVYDAVDSALTGELREQIDSSLARQGEIIDVLSESFGPYPFSTIGGIVEGQDDLFFALETQTRPVYSKLFWLDSEGNPEPNDGVVVHEIAHQWYGDDVALHRWQDIWLNEGFATYAEWLWAEYEGQGTTQGTFQAAYDFYAADDPFWSVVIGDPGVEQLFSEPVYVRGAMTLQALRNEVGDETFFDILRGWAATKSGGTGTTPQFIALAEDLAGRSLDEVWDPWLFTAGKPAFSEPSGATGAGAPSAQARGATGQWLSELEQRLAQHEHY